MEWQGSILMTLAHGVWPETTGNTAVVEQVGFVAWLGEWSTRPVGSLATAQCKKALEGLTGLGFVFGDSGEDLK